MRLTNIGLATTGLLFPAFALYACGSGPAPFSNGGGDDGGPGGGGGGDGGPGMVYNNADAAFANLSPDGAPAPNNPNGGSARGVFNAPDCPGCSFPPPNAPTCAATAPAIKVVYPNDGVLVPPNMSVMSVQWTPFNTAFKTFEVDIENTLTDTRIITKCAKQTVDTGQPPMPSGGCELVIDPKIWSLLSNANRGSSAVTISVRGTTDGQCASSSTNSLKMLFASEDVVGSLYYWKSTVTANGVGGQIWAKSFGDSKPEEQVTGLPNSVASLAQSCNGCHALSRDGLRMVVYSDDDDSDDEYGDVSGSLIDMATKMAIGVAAGGGGGRGGGGGGGRGGQPPGFSTLSPDHSYYLTSDGLGNGNPTNYLALWNGQTGMTIKNVTIGATATDRPTMPDWSPDGKSVIYVLPQKVAQWGSRNDDDHMFGGSLYTVPYMGNQVFGNPSPFLMSAGENNYYPSYSPDGQFVVFDRAPLDTSVSAVDGCNGLMPNSACPNDSFSNPAARLMLVGNTQPVGKPVDLEKANGSPAAAPVGLSNSWPRWSPFVQSYLGNRLLWVTFSSTRDYGVRVRNHKSGMYQCYPADSAENPGSPHKQPFDPLCQQPQLWMAAINLAEQMGVDPSRPAFWLPFQDITTHNHTPQWTQATSTPVDAGACIPTGGSCLTNPTACCGSATCGGTGTCNPIIR